MIKSKNYLFHEQFPYFIRIQENSIEFVSLYIIIQEIFIN